MERRNKHAKHMLNMLQQNGFGMQHAEHVTLMI